MTSIEDISNRPGVRTVFEGAGVRRLDKDIHALTALRGLAAALVVAYHFGFYKSTPEPITTFIKHGYLCVDFFFILSGFVMALTYGKVFSSGFRFNDYRGFIGKRFARLYPLYLLLTLVTIGYIYAGILQDYTPVTTQTVISNLTLTQTVGLTQSLIQQSWSISTEWVAYFLFPALAVLCLYKSPFIAVAAWLACFIILAGLAYIPEGISHIPHYNGPLDIIDYAHCGALIRCLVEFSLGLMCWRACQLLQVRRFAASDFAAPLVALIVLVGFSFQNTDLMVVMIFPILVIALSDNSSFLARVLSHRLPMWLGDISYSVYLIHFLVMPIRTPLQAFMDRVYLPHSYTVSLVLTYVAVFGLATVTFKYFELPARRKLRAMFESKPTPIMGL